MHSRKERTPREGARRLSVVSVDDDSIAEAFGRASAYAGIIMTIAFGLMMLAAAWLGW